MATRVYSQVMARNTRRFLEAVREDLPYPLRSVQVDGNEFRADFKATCEVFDLPLAVLLPKSPQINGIIERANDNSRTEFWNLCPVRLTVWDAHPHWPDSTSTTTSVLTALWTG